MVAMWPLDIFYLPIVNFTDMKMHLYLFLYCTSCIYFFSDKARCLTFNYNMYGDQTGELKISTLDSDNTETKLWSVSGNQGSQWTGQMVSVLTKPTSKVCTCLQNQREASGVEIFLCCLVLKNINMKTYQC